MQNKDLQQQIAYWKRTSRDDFKVAQSLFAKKYYPQCLFFCHLAVEKSLKALVVQRTGRTAPHIHDLCRLAEIAGITLDAPHARTLDEIFSFNIAGRYADAKLDFYKRYNRKTHALKHLRSTETIIVWLKNVFRKTS